MPAGNLEITAQHVPRRLRADRDYRDLQVIAEDQEEPQRGIGSDPFGSAKVLDLVDDEQPKPVYERDVGHRVPHRFRCAVPGVQAVVQRAEAEVDLREERAAHGFDRAVGRTRHLHPGQLERGAQVPAQLGVVEDLGISPQDLVDRRALADAAHPNDRQAVPGHRTPLKGGVRERCDALAEHPQEPRRRGVPADVPAPQDGRELLGEFHVLVQRLHEAARNGDHHMVPQVRRHRLLLRRDGHDPQHLALVVQDLGERLDETVASICRYLLFAVDHCREAVSAGITLHRSPRYSGPMRLQELGQETIRKCGVPATVRCNRP